MAEIQLVMTCSACPEQYDVMDGKDRIGYLRLRHGHFRADRFGTTVYEANTIGDGLFDRSERSYHLGRAVAAIVGADVPYTVDESFRREADRG